MNAEEEKQAAREALAVALKRCEQAGISDAVIAPPWLWQNRVEILQGVALELGDKLRNANATATNDPRIAELEKQNRRLIAALKKLADPASYKINSRNEIRWTRTDSSQYTPWGYARSILDGEK